MAAVIALTILATWFVTVTTIIVRDDLRKWRRDKAWRDIVRRLEDVRG